MNGNGVHTWHEANRGYLTAALAILRDRLDRYTLAAAGAGDANGKERAGIGERIEEKNGAIDRLHDTLRDAAEKLPAPSALDSLCATFGLSEFERDLLLLCAGVELDTGFADACRRAGGSMPTFSLALALFPGAHWSALTPSAPLRRWRLVDVGSGDTLTTSRVRIEEPVLHYLAGVPCLDERLTALTEEIDVPSALTPSHEEGADRIVSIWNSSIERRERLPAIRLQGKDRDALNAVAGRACAALGMSVRAMSIHSLPTAAADLEMFCRLWERDAAFHSLTLLLDMSDLGAEEGPQLRAAGRLVDELHGALLVAGEKGIAPRRRPIIPIEIPKPPAGEQRDLWIAALPGVNLNGHVEALTTQFDLGAAAIRSLSAGALRNDRDAEDERTPEEVAAALWNACRVNGRSRLDDLAQRIEPSATWEDLILPERQKGLLREMSLQARNRSIVHERWGFGTKGDRGLGISALFAGPSGTGKTMAAEVLARELRLDLYRIDLSVVISKYIGETEKNLKKIFDAADEGGALLLFDEADSLFGKRSEVKDSHDRYANIEVSYLLQRMEAYRGLAILTTNMKSALDSAFLRRIRFIVQFPFPDAESRAEIWRRVFPASTPTEGLDPLRLAQLNVTGGHIRNIALGGAFLAAESGEPVCMGHLLAAAKTELAKLEKNVTATEVRGWMR